MNNSCTVTRLVRWRIRDWVSCFYACRFRLEEEADKFCSMTPEKPRKMVFDPIGDSRKNRKKKLNKKMEQRIKERVKVSAEEKVEEGENDSNWPRFSEEDYIVFCFEDDGGIHIVEDRKLESFHQKIDHANKTSKPVCRKLIKYVENAPEVLPQSKNDTVSVDGENSYESAEEQIPISDDNGEDKWSNEMEDEWPPAVVKEISHIGEVSESKTTTKSAESSDSNYSNGSSGSFAFPVLGWEWMGSPAQMPKPEEEEEGPRFGKHKAWCSVRHHCCKF